MSEAVPVRCANRQPNLLTGEVCGWTGRRKGRRIDLGNRVVQLAPTHQRCPKCGSRVEEVRP
jgi:hypothetical protein